MAGDGKKSASATADSKRQRRYNGSEEQKRKRAQRNKIRRQMLREGRVHKGDGKDVDHITPIRNGGSNNRKNIRVISKSKNRANNGGTGGRKKE